MIKYILTFLFLAITTISYSQSQGSQSIKTTASMTDEQKIQEVFGTQFFNGRQSFYQFYLNTLATRLEYRFQAQDPDEKIPTVMSTGLQNKYNSNLQPLTSFDPTTFNPLRYKLDFFAKTVKKYRIDNSDYILIIKAQ